LNLLTKKPDFIHAIVSPPEDGVPIVKQPLSKTLGDSAEQEFNLILKTELKQVLNEFSDRFIEKIKREFFYRFQNQIIFEYENEVLSVLSRFFVTKDYE